MITETRPATASYAHLRDVHTQPGPTGAVATRAATGRPAPAVLTLALFGFLALAAYLVIMTN
jgi:hypothetical protein